MFIFVIYRDSTIFLIKTKVAYVVNHVVLSYATVVYSQYIFGRCLISVLQFQKFYLPLHSQIFGLMTTSMQSSMQDFVISVKTNTENQSVKNKKHSPLGQSLFIFEKTSYLSGFVAVRSHSRSSASISQIDAARQTPPQAVRWSLMLPRLKGTV